MLLMTEADAKIKARRFGHACDTRFDRVVASKELKVLGSHIHIYIHVIKGWSWLGGKVEGIRTGCRKCRGHWRGLGRASGSLARGALAICRATATVGLGSEIAPLVRFLHVLFAVAFALRVVSARREETSVLDGRLGMFVVGMTIPLLLSWKASLRVFACRVVALPWTTVRLFMFPVQPT